MDPNTRNFYWKLKGHACKTATYVQLIENSSLTLMSKTPRSCKHGISNGSLVRCYNSNSCTCTRILRTDAHVCHFHAWGDKNCYVWHWGLCAALRFVCCIEVCVLHAHTFWALTVAAGFPSTAFTDPAAFSGLEVHWVASGLQYSEVKLMTKAQPDLCITLNASFNLKPLSSFARVCKVNTPCKRNLALSWP